MTNSNYKQIISFGNETGFTNEKFGGLPKIELAKGQSLNDNVIGLAHELTNRALGPAFDKADEEVSYGDNYTTIPRRTTEKKVILIQQVIK